MNTQVSRHLKYIFGTKSAQNPQAKGRNKFIDQRYFGTSEHKPLSAGVAK